MTESIDAMIRENGAGFASAPPKLGGFRASSLWDGVYDFNPFADVTGEMPPPTPARIDAFRRAMSEFAVEGQRIAHELEQAEAKRRTETRKARDAAAEKGEEYVEPFSAEEARKEYNAILDQEQHLYDGMRDQIAEFGKGRPTRKQLDKVPNAVVGEYVGYLGEQINPTR